MDKLKTSGQHFNHHQLSSSDSYILNAQNNQNSPQHHISTLKTKRRALKLQKQSEHNNEKAVHHIPSTESPDILNGIEKFPFRSFRSTSCSVVTPSLLCTEPKVSSSLFNIKINSQDLTGNSTKSEDSIPSGQIKREQYVHYSGVKSSESNDGITDSQSEERLSDSRSSEDSKADFLMRLDGCSGQSSLETTETKNKFSLVIEEADSNVSGNQEHSCNSSPNVIQADCDIPRSQRRRESSSRIKKSTTKLLSYQENYYHKSSWGKLKAQHQDANKTETNVLRRQSCPSSWTLKREDHDAPRRRGRPRKLSLDIKETGPDISHQSNWAYKRENRDAYKPQRRPRVLSLDNDNLQRRGCPCKSSWILKKGNTDAPKRRGRPPKLKLDIKQAETDVIRCQSCPHKSILSVKKENTNASKRRGRPPKLSINIKETEVRHQLPRNPKLNLAKTDDVVPRPRGRPRKHFFENNNFNCRKPQKRPSEVAIGMKDTENLVLKKLCQRPLMKSENKDSSSSSISSLQTDVDEALTVYRPRRSSLHSDSSTSFHGKDFQHGEDWGRYIPAPVKRGRGRPKKATLFNLPVESEQSKNSWPKKTHRPRKIVFIGPKNRPGRPCKYIPMSASVDNSNSNCYSQSTKQIVVETTIQCQEMAIQTDAVSFSQDEFFILPDY